MGLASASKVPSTRLPEFDRTLGFGSWDEGRPETLEAHAALSSSRDRYWAVRSSVTISGRKGLYDTSKLV
jgi:hypothetical protein